MKFKPSSKRIINIVSLSLYFLSTILILIESCLPSSLSSLQSNSIGSFIVSLINGQKEGKPKDPIYPSSISLSYPQDERLLKKEEAVIGTTKLIQYSLSFDNESSSTYEVNDIQYSLIKGNKEDIQLTYSPSTKNGAIRCIPFKEGEFEIELFSKSNKDVKAKISFNSYSNKDIPSSFITYFGKNKIELEVNKPKKIEYYFNVENSSYSYDYLLRFYKDNPSFYSSSNILEIDSGYLVPKEEGETSLYLGETKICDVTIKNSSYVIPSSFSFSKEKEEDLHPLDYDYIEDEYGGSLNSDVAYPIVYTSSNSLIGKILNEHYLDSSTLIKPRLYGYRRLGEVTINARLVGTNIVKSLNVKSSEVEASSFSLNIQADGESLSLNKDTSLEIGRKIFLNPTFNPKNASNPKLHIEASSNIEVFNNDSSSPYLLLKEKGLGRVAISLGERKEEYEFNITTPLAISKEEEGEVKYSLRKFIGHFLLFATNAIFLAIAFFSTSFVDKKDKAIGLLLCLFSGLFIALLSESIQGIPSLKRGPSLLDVGIDYAGFASGFLFVFLILLLIYSFFFLKRRICNEKKKKN